MRRGGKRAGATPTETGGRNRPTTAAAAPTRRRMVIRHRCRRGDDGAGRTQERAGSTTRLIAYRAGRRAAAWVALGDATSPTTCDQSDDVRSPDRLDVDRGREWQSHGVGARRWASSTGARLLWITQGTDQQSATIAVRILATRRHCGDERGDARERERRDDEQCDRTVCNCRCAAQDDAHRQVTTVAGNSVDMSRPFRRALPRRSTTRPSSFDARSSLLALKRFHVIWIAAFSRVLVLVGFSAEAASKAPQPANAKPGDHAGGILALDTVVLPARAAWGSRYETRLGRADVCRLRKPTSVASRRTAWRFATRGWSCGSRRRPPRRSSE
jgi:hypothetical protein